MAKDFGIAPSTLSTILSSKEVITGAVARGVKRYVEEASVSFEAVEEAPFKWFLDARPPNLPVSGALLQRKKPKTLAGTKTAKIVSRKHLLLRRPSFA